MMNPEKDEKGPAEQLPPDVAAPAQPDPAECWPARAANHGELWSCLDPKHGNRLMVMTLETWLEVKQGVDTMQKDLIDAKAANIKLFQENQELQKRLTEQHERHKTALDKPDGPRIITPRGGM